MAAKHSTSIPRLASAVSVAGLLASGAVLAMTPALANENSTQSISQYSAAMNYRLHCEGCHKDDGSGQPGFIPALRGQVARFLASEQGRTYIARVPGTAQSLLSDAERADVLNWIVERFDREHVPASFVPFSASEVAPWRHDALSAPAVERARVLAAINGQGVGPGSALPSSPGGNSGNTRSGPSSVGNSAAMPVPTNFAICAACHTTGADGAHGVGPNLRGIFGRAVGGAPQFTYSPAMRNTKRTWTAEELDAYLQSPATRIPGNYMSYPGIRDASERQAIVKYLGSLQ